MTSKDTLTTSDSCANILMWHVDWHTTTVLVFLILEELSY